MKCVICSKENDRKICEECDAQIEQETKEREALLRERERGK